MENPTEVLEECLQTFKTTDYIMEVGYTFCIWDYFILLPDCLIKLN